ncbi:MAG: hypothetical protein Q9217_001861 [Psora testacea]
MIICMRGEDHSWRAIEQRWKDMTGQQIPKQALQHRYRILKKKMRLFADEDIERVLISEATAKSKTDGEEIGIAQSKMGRKPSIGSRKGKKRAIVDSKYMSARASQPDILIPNLVSYPLRPAKLSDSELSEGPVAMIFEAESPAGKRKASKRMRSRSVSPSKRAVFEQGNGLELKAWGSDRGSDGIDELCISDKTELYYVTDAKRRMLKGEINETEEDIVEVPDREEGIGWSWCFNQDSMPLTSEATVAVESKLYRKELPSELHKVKSKHQHNDTEEATRWVKIKLPSRRGPEVLSSGGALQKNKTCTGDAVNYPTELCSEDGYGDTNMKQPKQAEKRRLYLRPPRPLEPSENSSLTASAQTSPFSGVERRAQASTQCRDWEPVSNTLQLTNHQLRSRKEWAKNSAPEASTETLRNGASDVSAGLHKKQYRSRMSIAVRAAWAKRQAEGRNGRYGGLPTLRTIMAARRKAKRNGVAHKHGSSLEHSRGTIGV